MNKTWFAVAILSSITAATTHAEVTINGFASVKAGITTGHEDTLYGYNNDLDFKNESLFAIQVQSDLGDKLSVTAQLMGRGKNDFDAEFEWAFLSYQISDSWRLNAGRLRTPFYKYSDFKDVGYAYDWARTPQSVYSLGFDTIEGLSLYHSGNIAEMQSSLQLVYGGYDGSVTLQGQRSPAKINDILGVTWELSQDWISMRMAYLQGDVTIQATALNPLFGALNAFGFSAVTKEIDFDQDDGRFFGFGMNYDRNDWLAVFEYTHVKVRHSFLANQASYYLSLGHRFDAIVPYISYEKDDDQAKPEIYAGIPLTAPFLRPVADLVLSQLGDRDTWNIGLRYDFHPSAAFKMELTSAKDNYTLRKDSLLTMGVDLVF